MTFLSQPSSPALTHKMQEVWFQPREPPMCARPQGTGVPLHFSFIVYYKGQHPNPVELQWTFHVSSALFKVWGERVDRLGRVSSVTRPGPLQRTPPHPRLSWSMPNPSQLYHHHFLFI